MTAPPSTPLKRLPAPGVVCGCFFGVDRCSECVALRSRADKSSNGKLATLPEDVLENIARLCGPTLPAFASVNHAVRAVVRPAMWQQAYEEASGAPLTCGDALPPALWKACLLKDRPCAPCA